MLIILIQPVGWPIVDENVSEGKAEHVRQHERKVRHNRLILSDIGIIGATLARNDYTKYFNGIKVTIANSNIS